MPRDIPVGNGSMLVAFDREYQIRDFYYPHVGQENHSIGHPSRMGVWVDGQFSWLNSEWQKILNYKEDTLVTDVKAKNNRLKIELQMYDTVDFHLNIFVKEIIVRNLEGRDREIRLFFNHDFHIYGNEVGDTAYYDPDTRAVIHYKAQRYFLINCCDPNKCGIDHFATGIKEVLGAEGTWRDAEDGKLSGNPIAQGSVDSTLGINLEVKAYGENVAHYWIAAGTKHREVVRLNKIIWEKTPEELIRRTENYWKLWVNKEMINFYDLPQKIVSFFKRSLLIIRTQIDAHGAIIAANDSDIISMGRDTYSYMWPRDGALVAYALIKCGYMDVTKQFFKFCAEVLSAEGYLLHKYNPDGSFASSWHPWLKDNQKSLPIQEDGIALVIWALWNHYHEFRDIEFVKPLYKSLIINTAEFMVRFRDEETGLPLSSYDLWEERYGVHTFTVSAVIAGLRAAGNFACAFGEQEYGRKYYDIANNMKNALITYFYQEKEERFARMGTKTLKGYELDMTADASLFGLVTLDVFSPELSIIASTMNAVKEELRVKTSVGGVARYTNDYYHQVSNDIERIPGNPWFICTLWLADYEIAKARNLTELNSVLSIVEWVVDRAFASGVLAEQVNPYTNEPLSVSPLTWSHAAFVTVLVKYMEKREKIAVCAECGNSVLYMHRHAQKPCDSELH
ncbi:MAG: glycoside hydrolase family 15 protein [Candidatus Jettenia sp.]|uniref:Glycoside hydrolase n=1 Tax=Candidatus Jettenia caeni TaxID=247490 RepID=I3IHX2_9BACT|nr:glycoside hydrolase family 15 protein [Candidatus Jettenia sp. AMX1]MBC6929998.1 glycoside hydrolase family 15 protein [Candidatus Jettenia sp.]NUN24357.1 glycoside hydrolase family 15 protein [Candidatus Jettenia caeni]KAA0248393.1 MAG: glycoside hydrolase family 15 protein [Candidatus Jettenia sp. AMX1]MCE7881631.1 glycoside hydrolase family 15 protein [Candidatus Jettenia sp. AMX1]MCQ3928278.1 glycoside hydrolase family 15 protein [Candidatus Jettenia sp.]